MKRPVLLFSFSLLFFQLFAQHLQVVQLKCAYKKDPLGIEQASPALSWELQSNERNVLQTAYRILVAEDIESLNRNVGTVWDSQKTLSEASVQVSYKGKKLESARTYYWKVQVWDNKSHQSPWSAIAKWQTGLRAASDWKGAKWIAYGQLADSLKMIPAEHQKGSSRWWGIKDTLPLLRKLVTLNKPLKRVTVFISGLGQFEMSINGKKVGDHFLDPGWTQYDKEAQYVVFDVTQYVKQGSNAIGVMLGNGFYFIPRQRYRKLTGAFGFPKMILRMLVEYRDGSSQNIVSDQSWKTYESPIRFSSIYGGEDYDATKEQKGWNTVSFNDKKWKPVVVVKGPEKLYAQATPLKVYETFEPVRTKSVNDRIYVYDLGQNASGIPQITVRGKRGDTVRIVPAELLKEDGTANQKATGSPAYFEYVLKGEGAETWQPRFSYYGFRYLQVEGAVPNAVANPGRLPVVLQLKGLHTRNAVERVGTFESSNALFNQTNKLIDWAIKSNLASLLTDCPHREKLGWLEQTHLMGNSIRFNYNMADFFKKTVRDMMTAQSPEGVVPEYAPEYVVMPFMDSIFMDSPEWGSAAIILPWYLYRWYGDTQTMKESYPMMKRYLEHLKRKSKGNIVSYGLSDWYDLGPNKPGLSQLTPMGLTATAFYYHDLELMGTMAFLLGKKEEGNEYRKRAAAVKDAFNSQFFNEETKQYGTGSQTANAIAVHMNLVPPSERKAVVENIVRDVRLHNNSLTTGDVGYRFLLKVLDEEGRSDVIFDMNNRSDVPGYGYQLVKGATSLTESWQALPTVSNNHLMLGHLMEWFYAGLAGINQADSSIGFKRIEIRPQPVGDVTMTKATYATPYGVIVSEWTKKNNVYELKVQIPVNTTAMIYLPSAATSQIYEGNSPVIHKNGMQIMDIKKGATRIAVGSGTYHFLVKDTEKRLTKTN